MVDVNLLTEEQLALKARVKEFADKEVRPTIREYDVSGEFPFDIYKKAVAEGFTRLHFPAEFGGLGRTCLEQTIMTEELTKADAGLCVAVGGNDLASVPVLLGGNNKQKAMLGDVLKNGGTLAFCLTEPNAGSDVSGMNTHVVDDGDSYVINGRKCFITNGGIADCYTVFATVNRSLGAKGISAFIVERDRPGVSTGSHENKLGIRSSNTADVIFEDVRIPKDHLIGDIGTGMKLAMGTLDLTRGSDVPAAAVGLSQEAIDCCIEYANTNYRDGKLIIAHQGIQFMIAEMEIRTRVARQMVYHCARLIDKGVLDTITTSSSKAFAGDAVMRTTTDAVQVFGDYGYLRDYPVEKLMRDAKIYQIFEGTAEIQRVAIANALSRQYSKKKGNVPSGK